MNKKLAKEEFEKLSGIALTEEEYVKLTWAIPDLDLWWKEHLSLDEEVNAIRHIYENKRAE